MSGLPVGWVSATLDELNCQDAPICYGVLKPGDRPADGIPMVRVTDIRGNEVDLDHTITITPELDEEFRRSRILPFDVLISVQGTVGRVAVVPSGAGKANISRTIARLRPVDPEFATWLGCVLRSPQLQADLDNLTGGTTRDSLNIGDLRTVPVPLPPLPEQRRIVAKIDSLTAKSRRAREHFDHIPRLVEKYKHAVLEAAFRGDLTREWRHRRPPHGDASGVHERLTDLPLLPADWVWASMGALGQISGGLTKNPARNGLPIRIPYLRVANVYANQLRLDEVAEIGCTPDERQKTLLVPGDLLVVEGNGSLDQIGRVAIWNGELPQCSHQNHLIKIRLNDVVIPEFALFWLMSPQGRNAIQSVASSSAGLFSLSISKVRGLPIPICAAEQQRRVVDRIRVALTWIDRLAAEATSARTLVDRLDQAVLAKAFRGELVPQDPADEPASVLLDRIRAERAAAPKPKRGRRPRAAA